MEDENKDLEELDDDLNYDDIEEEEVEEQPKKKVQDENERARQAKARREREAKERETREKAIKDEAYLKGQLDSTKVNTFTNEEIEDEYDLKIFTIQKQLEKEGKDPISDLPKRLAELNRSAGKKAQEEAKEKKEREDSIDKDLKDFRSKNPKVDVTALLKDPDFQSYTEGRLGVKGGKSLAQLYADFETFKAKYEKKETKVEDDAKASSPSPSGQPHKKTSFASLSEEDKIKELKRQGLI